MSVRYDIRPRITLEEVMQSLAAHRKSTFSVQTKMKSEALLRNTLAKLYNATINDRDNALETEISGHQLVFRMSSTGFYEIQYFKSMEGDAVRTLVRDMEAEYRGMVQDYVYNTIKTKAEEKGLVLEQETVQKNQSIVLTFNLNG
ncbi:hypothetical protein ACTJJB_14060 [Chitinophaga sp. 22536]|uniref:hypothetical protein n=1 Tax=unclassified Chitinophaga TaxID=2619133 RepID=UPI003F85825D